MAKAVICPICHGKGEIETGVVTTAGKEMKTCYGCNGMGWIEVSDDICYSHPYCPPYPYSPWYPGTYYWEVT